MQNEATPEGPAQEETVTGLLQGRYDDSYERERPVLNDVAGTRPHFGPSRKVRLASNGFSFVLVDTETGETILGVQRAVIVCDRGEFTSITLTLDAAEVDVDGVLKRDAVQGAHLFETR